MGINRLPPKINRSIIIFLEKRRRLQLSLPFRVSRKRLILLRIEEEKKFFLSILNNLRHARARKGREQQVQSKGVDRSTARGASKCARIASRYAGEKSVEIGPVGQLEVTNPPPTYYFENDPLLSRQLTGGIISPLPLCNSSS